MSKLSDEEINDRLKAAIVVKRLDQRRGLIDILQLLNDMAANAPVMKEDCARKFIEGFSK